MLKGESNCENLELLAELINTVDAGIESMKQARQQLRRNYVHTDQTILGTIDVSTDSLVWLRKLMAYATDLEARRGN